jgi:hypothetical protein
MKPPPQERDYCTIKLERERDNERVSRLAAFELLKTVQGERDQARKQLEEERAAHKRTIEAASAYADSVMAHTNKLEQLIKPMLDDIAAITKGGKASQ